MRHRKKRVFELRGGAQKYENVVRNLITALIREGKVTTTQKRGKVLVAEMEKFIGDLLKVDRLYEDQKDRQREAIRRIKRVVFGEAEGKKMLNELLPQIRQTGRTSGFVRLLKLNSRR